MAGIIPQFSTFDLQGFENICKHCYGLGKVESTPIYTGYSLRNRDTEVICKHCNGTGRVKED